MAYANTQIIEALTRTAARLRTDVDYRWTHMGACNCGHLAQTVTTLSRAELHAMALEKPGDWSEQAVDFCPTSGYPMDHVIATMLELGLTTQDLVHLERLSDPDILARLPSALRHVDYRKRDDVVRYLDAWAELLSDQLARSTTVLNVESNAATPSPGRRAA